MRPNEVLYAVIAVIGGYVFVSIFYRFVRGNLYRRRRVSRGVTNGEAGEEGEEAHREHRERVLETEREHRERVLEGRLERGVVGARMEFDMSHIYIVRSGPMSVPPRAAVAPELAPLESFKATKAMKETVCGICLETFGEDDISSGVCGHSFHTSCISSWLRKDSARSCPICRNKYLGGDEAEDNDIDNVSNNNNSDAASTEAQGTVGQMRPVTYPMPYPQLTHGHPPIHPYFYVHNLSSLTRGDIP